MNPSARPVKLSPRHWVAHRGYPSRYPENTLRGFQQAIATGALYIEADMQLTADHVPVLFHDDELGLLCGVLEPRQLHNLYAVELEHFSPHAPMRFGDQYRGEPLLLLADLLELLARNPQVTLFLEVKTIAVEAFSAEVILDVILPMILPLRAQVVLISYHLSFMAAAQAAGWQRLGPVLERGDQLCDPQVEALQPEYLFIHIIDLPAEKPPVVAPIVCFESSDLNQAQTLLDWGVAMVETDAIAEMLA